MKHIVSIERVQHYDMDAMLHAVRAIYRSADGPTVKGRSVLLKPNIVSDSAPEKAITTHPDFFKAVALFFKEEGVEKIYAGDSPGVHTKKFTAETCGIRAVCRDLDIEWVDFMENPVTRNGFKYAGIIEKVDLIVSLPKCKTHELAYYTGAIKNLFGLMPGFSKGLMHVKHPDRKDFSAAILDFYQGIKADFAFMDAIVAMEGPGPGNGSPYQLGLILGSRNCISLDVIASQIIGYGHGSVPMLAEAEKRQLPGSSMADIILSGGDLKDFKVKDYELIPPEKKNRFLALISMITPSRKFQRKLEKRPVFKHKNCILCGQCVLICQAKALKIVNNKIVINDDKCIRCYCCHEVCPANAITIKRKIL